MCCAHRDLPTRREAFKFSVLQFGSLETCPGTGHETSLGPVRRKVVGEVVFIFLWLAYCLSGEAGERDFTLGWPRNSWSSHILFATERLTMGYSSRHRHNRRIPSNSGTYRTGFVLNFTDSESCTHYPTTTRSDNYITGSRASQD